MGKTTIEGVFAIIAGYEEDHIIKIKGLPRSSNDPNLSDKDEFTDYNNTHFGISDILEKAGGITTSWGEAHNFETLAMKDAYTDGSEDPDILKMNLRYIEQAQEDVTKYRTRTGHKYPPLFRIKINVELEPATPEDAEEYWSKCPY